MSGEAKPWEPQHNWGQTVLKPRNEGEDLKIQQVELKRRDRNLEFQADRSRKLKNIKDAKTGRVQLDHITAEKLVKRNLTAKRSKNSMKLKMHQKKQKKLKQRKADSKTSDTKYFLMKNLNRTQLNEWNITRGTILQNMHCSTRSKPFSILKSNVTSQKQNRTCDIFVFHFFFSQFKMTNVSFFF